MSLLFCLTFSLFFLGVASAQSVDLSSPTDVTASGSPILLKWKDNSQDEGRFVVERRPALRLSWEKIAHVDWNVTSYMDHRTEAGRYCYRVSAENFSGMSQPSNEVCINFTPPALAPPVLTYSICCVSAAAPKGVAVLTWPPPPPGTGIHIERRWRSGDEPWIRLPSIPAAEGVWHEHDLTLMKPWCWRAVYARGKEDSALSNRVCSNE